MTMKLLFFTIFFFFLFCFVSPAFSCHPNDKKALLRIKKALKNPSFLDSWDPKIDCCTNWIGVECTRRRVTSLLIQSDELSAQIPPEIGDLPFLRSLDFNNLSDLTGNIPRTITKLKHLDTLRFRNTMLSGPIPDFIGELKEITFLDLSFNQFNGSIPSSLPKMPKLDAVQLNDNQLTGSVPESFGSFVGTGLYLGYNRLSGNPSMIFGANKATTRLDLSNNNFRFDISKVKFSKSLEYLDLSHNLIYGTLPSQLSHLTLESFNVSYNRLCGRIPQGGVLQKFDIYAFSNNRCLCGPPLKNKCG